MLLFGFVFVVVVRVVVRVFVLVAIGVFVLLPSLVHIVAASGCHRVVRLRFWLSCVLLLVSVPR